MDSNGLDLLAEDGSPIPEGQSEFMGTPYSTAKAFDYPFPVSNEPIDPLAPLPSAFGISSLVSAPSIITAASEDSGTNPTNVLPSLMSGIAATPDLPLAPSYENLVRLHSRSTSSLSSSTSSRPVSAFGQRSQSPGPIQGGSPQIQPRTSGRHSIAITPFTSSTSAPSSFSPVKPAKRPKSMTIHSSETSTTSSASGSSKASAINPSSLSINSFHLLNGHAEPPMPPSLLNKLTKFLNDPPTGDPSNDLRSSPAMKSRELPESVPAPPRPVISRPRPIRSNTNTRKDQRTKPTRPQMSRAHTHSSIQGSYKETLLNQESPELSSNYGFQFQSGGLELTNDVSSNTRSRRKSSVRRAVEKTSRLVGLSLG